MNRLKNKNIYFIVTGAKKAKLAEKIIAEMISEGAKVFTIPTKASLQFINLKKLKKIKGNIVKTDWSDKIELPKEDAVLISPCTFNTLNCLAAGLADTYPLCLVASSLGNKVPIFIAPAMNKSLWEHPIIKENIAKLENWGCRIIWPEIKSDKVTMIDQGKILDTLYFHFCRINYQDERKDSSELNNNLLAYRQKYFDIFKKVGQYLAANNLNSPTAGCLSIKVPAGILITSSGSDLVNLKKENLSLIISWNEKETKIVYIGDCLPSSESPLHCLVHESYQDNFVLHFHCPSITYNDKYSRYKTKNYVRYGCFETGRRVLKKLQQDKFCIMKYHGEILIGNNIDELLATINKFKIKE